MHNHSDRQHYPATRERSYQGRSLGLSTALLGVFTCIFFALATNAMALTGKWHANASSSTITCESSAGRAITRLSRLAQRVNTPNTGVGVAHHAYLSPQSEAAADISFHRSTTSIRFYTGCRLAWTRDFPDHESIGHVLVDSGYGLLVILSKPRENLPDSDDPDLPGAVIHISSVGKVARMHEFFDVLGIQDVPFSAGSNPRYASLVTENTYHFYDLGRQQHHSYKPSYGEYIRKAEISETGQIRIYRLHKIVLMNGREIGPDEFKLGYAKLWEKYGEKAMLGRREVLEIAHEHAF